MKSLAIVVALALALINTAECLFKTFEIRPSHYVAISDYIQQDRQDRPFIYLVDDAFSDGKITSREYKPIVDHVLDKYGIYEHKIEVPHTVESARANLHQVLANLSS